MNANDYRDIINIFKITKVPQFSFYLNGREHKKYIGANEEDLKAYLADLDNQV